MKFTYIDVRRLLAQSVMTIQILEKLLRSCVLVFGGSWKDQLLWVEFTYNNNYQATIDMTSFKALNERKYHTL